MSATACKNLFGTVERARYLLSHVSCRKSNLVTNKDGAGRTPLDISSEKGHKQCSEFLTNVSSSDI